MTHHTGAHGEDELPEHETRPEGQTGGGLTTSGISAEQRGPLNDEVLEAERREAGTVADDEDDALGYDRQP